MFPVFPSNPIPVFDAEEEEKQKIMKNCEMLEYEHDMGATVPYCRIYCEPCYVQCEKKFEVEEE